MSESMSVTATPAVTVLMPVYNAERYLQEAVESILRQTFSDFEFLIINDGSADATVDIIESYRDPRIRLVHNDRNLGVIETLNSGMQIAQGRYIARMDADDISEPDRLHQQVAFLEEHSSTELCGTWFTFMGTGITVRHPVEHERIKIKLLSDTAFAHPSVMFRKTFFLENGLFYNPAFRHAEDYELWTRLVPLAKTANIPRVLLHYRLHDAQVSMFHCAAQEENTNRVRLRQLNTLHLRPDTAEQKMHLALLTGKKEACCLGALAWIVKLYRANAKTGAYDARLFSAALAQWLWAACASRTKSYLKNYKCRILQERP